MFSSLIFFFLACHYTCDTCSGPNDNECIDCNSVNHRTLSAGTCPCEAGYRDNGGTASCEGMSEIFNFPRLFFGPLHPFFFVSLPSLQSLACFSTTACLTCDSTGPGDCSTCALQYSIYAPEGYCCSAPDCKVCDDAGGACSACTDGNYLSGPNTCSGSFLSLKNSDFFSVTTPNFTRGLC